MRFQNAGRAEGTGDTRAHAIVAGGGFGGMATALILARAGWRVTVFEGDRVAPIGDTDAAFTHSRPGVPHARQTHGLLARLTTELEARLPDVLDDLLAAGAVIAPFAGTGRPARMDTDPVTVLLVRRTTLEWVLRRRVLADPAIRWCDDTRVLGVTGRPTMGAAPAVVTGVHLADGRELAADVVVACTGRRGDVPGWLRALDAVVGEESHPTELVYLTRWYRLPEGATVPMSPKLTGDLGHLRYLAVPGDAGTFAVSMAVPAADDHLRRHLGRAPTFDRAAARLPGIDEVFAAHHLTPISGVEPMGGFVNRLRRFTGDDGAPIVAGFHAVGDAHTCTNPYYGRGCTLTLVQAGLLADALAGAHDPLERSAAYERANGAQIEPWFHHAVQLDVVFDRRQRGEQVGGDGLDMASALALVMAAADDDPVLFDGLMRVFNLLTLPDQLLAEPAFITRALAVLSDPTARASLVRPGPSREQLLV